MNKNKVETHIFIVNDNSVYKFIHFISRVVMKHYVVKIGGEIVVIADLTREQYGEISTKILTSYDSDIPHIERVMGVYLED